MRYLNTEIRPACDEDLPSIEAIENLCFINPFAREDLLYELHSNPYANCVVIELSNDSLGLKQICGFCDFWVTFDSATITQIAVHPDLHHMGLGSELLEDTIATCKAKKVRTISLEVRKSNEKAIGLYKKYGFNVVCIKEGYYKDHEDALYMVLEVK